MEIWKHVSLNIDVRGLGQSATFAIQAKCRELQKKGKMVYNFGLGQSPFPVPTPVVEALRYHAHEKDYLPVKGLSALRKSVANFHRQKDHLNINPDFILIGPGSKELMFLLQLVFYGEIIIPTPCWVSYVPQANILGRKIRLIPTRYEDHWKITPDMLKEL
ncbi:MAG: aspartate aminotransferase, partial [Thermoprotei archaeon]